ncbi:MAG: hypothetical protein R3208_15375 [Ketobacteraceae bacterium]|nr:hypothetical protein [Ketobacteraceae bacterium]
MNKALKSVLSALSRKLLILAMTSVISFQVMAVDEYRKYSTEFIAPKGVVAVNFRFSQGRVSSAYDQDGNLEKFSDSLSGIPLDTFGLAGDSTDVDLRYQTEFLELTVGYGLTDNVAIGVQMLIGESCSDASLETQNGFGQLLGGALTDPDGNFAYSDIDSHCESGVFAPILGAAWRIYEGKYDSLIFLPGIRLGGATDAHDPDVLFQPIIDDGTDDIIIRFDYFRDLTHSFDIAGQFEYAYALPDERTMRVDQSGIPITPIAFKEKVERNAGDYALMDVEFGYRFLDDQARVYIAYYIKDKQKDKFQSDSGLSTEFLEENSDFRDEEYRIGFTWDGVPAWQAGTVPVPFKAEINFWESFRGKNFFKYYFTEFKVTLAF